MTRLFDRSGNPITFDQWAKSFDDTTLKRVAYTTTWNGFHISTVWLGLDHQFGLGPPLIFETMVFPKFGFRQLDMARYSTEAQAISGHKAMVSKWSRKFPCLLPRYSVPRNWRFLINHLLRAHGRKNTD